MRMVSRSGFRCGGMMVGLCLAAVLAPVRTPDAFAGVVFTDDFESGTLLTTDSPAGAWDSTNESRGAISIATLPSPVFKGSDSCRLSWASIAWGRLMLYSPTWSDITNLYVRMFIYIDDYVPAVDGDLRVLTPFSATGTTIFSLEVSRGGTMKLRVDGPLPGWGGANTELELDRWYCVEIYLVNCSAPGTADGELTIWLDGVEDLHTTNLDTSDGFQVNQIAYCALGGSGGDLTANVYYDDVLFSDALDTSAFVLLSPIGGESWAVDNQEAIRWLRGTGIVNVRIEISRDGGTSWTEDIVASTPNTGSYTWTVSDDGQALPQNDCLIRISDAAVPATQDQSHAAFTISGGIIGLTAPNGGQTLRPKRAVEVTWTSTGLPGVDILLSTDSGGTFGTTLSINAADDGTHYVCVPDLGAEYTTCRIRVQETGGAGLMDDSDADFTINAFAPEIVFSDDFESGGLLETDTPAGVWDATHLQDSSVFTIASLGDGDPVYSGTYSAEAYFNYPGYDTWCGLAEILDPFGTPVHCGEIYVGAFVYIDSSTDCDQFGVFRLRTGADTTSYSATTAYLEYEFYDQYLRLIVCPKADGDPGVEHRTYVVDGTNALTVDRWHYIELCYRMGAPGLADGLTRVWVDGQLEMEATGQDLTDGDGNAYPANVVTIGGRSKYDGGNATVYYDDVIVANHRVTPQLAVLFPGGGDNLAVDTGYDIRWIPGDTVAVPDVHIELSRDGGTSWEEIIDTTPNDGTYTWTVIQGGLPLPQDNCIIRVSDVVDGDPFGDSPVFNITGATIAITNPTGGEEWGVGGPRTVEWHTEGVIPLVDIQISRDGGTTWQDIATGVANSGSQIWDVNDGGQILPQSNCIIRVRDAAEHGTYGDSGAFTIAAGSITVTLPVGGESWAGGTAQEIHWTSNLGSEGLISIAIAISYNNGANYQVLSGGGGTVNDGVSFFGVPDHPSSECKISVSFGVVVGESAAFTITPQDYSVAWSDGFESGTLVGSDTPPGAWDSYSTEDQSELLVATSNPAPYAGTYRAEGHVDNTGDPVGDTSTNYNLNETVYSDGRTCINVRSYMLLESLVPEYYAAKPLHTLGISSGDLSFVRIKSDTGEFVIGRSGDGHPNGSGQWDDDPAGVLPADSAWHRVDFWHRTSTVDSAVDGVLRLYIDGVMTGEATGLETWDIAGIIHPVKGAGLGGWTGSYDAMDFSSFFDDVSVSLSEPGGPHIVVLSPSGSEEWMVGDDHDIIWHVTDKLDRNVTHVDIQSSRDNGATWTETIATNVDVSTLAYDAVTDSYTYTWNVTTGGLPTVPPQDQCLIRVIDVTAGNPGNSGECDFNFIIGEPQIEVITPNGTEVWGVGTDRTITWTSLGVGFVNVCLSRDGGTTFPTIWTCDASLGSYTWPVTGPPSAVCLIRVEDTGAPAVRDDSDAFFSIVDATIQVTAPNGAEVFNVGEVTNVTWTSTGLINVQIELSRDGNWTNGDGSDVEVVIASTDAATGTYAWTVTGPLSANCLVRISDVDATPSDESDAVFSIQGLDLTAPVGGETWDAGSTQTITWTAQGPAQIDIELSRDDGGTWETIDTNVDATLAAYDWDVTGPGSIQCIIKISESTTGSPADESENVFTIAGVDVTLPNGGELWNLGENVNITWNSAGFANAMIELSRDGNWVNGDGSDVEELVASTDATVGSWGWVVTGPSSTTCLVRVSDTDGSPSDESDAVFQILAPTIIVTSPAAGDAWPVASSRDITWSAAGVANVKIDVSRDGGASWEAITATTNAGVGSYTWDPVTGAGSTTCVIRVADVLNPITISGDSAGFTISEIAVAAPAVGDIWCCDGDDQDITWTSIGITSNVDIAYSVDGGTTWTDIVLNEPDDGSYTWTIPNEDSTNCVVRVEETGGGGAIGLSEVFTLTPATIAVILPAAGGSWGLGTAQTVTWTCAGLSSVIIELSRDGNWVNGDGSDVETIVASTDATTGSYTWGAVTGPESTDCLVKVSDANDGVPSGVSGTFTIAMASLALVSPDGGEIWSIGKTATVTWDQVGVTAVQIELSADGGTTWTEIIPDADGQIGSYAWMLSATASGNCVVRITAGGALTDMSVGTFWIINPNGDTDGDGFTDQEEVDGGTNPFDKKDKPPVMFHGKTGCGAAPLGSGLLPALLAALAGISFLKRRK